LNLDEIELDAYNEANTPGKDLDIAELWNYNSHPELQDSLLPEAD